MDKLSIAVHTHFDKLFNKTSITAAVIGGFFAGILGGWDGLLRALVILTVIDYLTGVIKAVINKCLSSQVGFVGILKKVLLFSVVAVAVQIQTVAPSLPLREMTILFFMANEGLSVLENCAGIIPLPDKLKSVLLQIRSKDKEDNPND